MKILNFYCSHTGNTQKVATQIEQTAKLLGHDVTTLAVTVDIDEKSFDFLDFDFVFIGSGVYTWLPPKPMLDFFKAVQNKHVAKGDIKSCAPRLEKKRAVAYCTFGGAHTGKNEAVTTPKFLGQLLDHLGFEIIDEWLFEGQYNSKGYEHFSIEGRMGDITGRPNEDDLRRVASLVTGVLQV